MSEGRRIEVIVRGVIVWYRLPEYVAIRAYQFLGAPYIGAEHPTSLGERFNYDVRTVVSPAEMEHPVGNRVDLTAKIVIEIAQIRHSRIGYDMVRI